MMNLKKDDFSFSSEPVVPPAAFSESDNGRPAVPFNCPECGVLLVRFGTCFSCPLCGLGSCE